MFQTEINIALQSISSGGLTWLMRQITATGYSSFVVALIITIIFGVNLRRGFLLFQIIVWTGMVSELCKMLFRMPRPFFADNRVMCLEPGWNNSTPFYAQGASSFFSLPPHPVIDAFRLQNLSFGFPSGHVSGSIAIWGGLAVLFRNRRLAWLAPFFVFLIAFSRLYLGVHFLGDVLGGILLGGLMLLLAYRLIIDPKNQQQFFATAELNFGAVLPMIIYVLFMFILPLLMAVFALIDVALAGFFIGLNAAFTLLLKEGLPEDGGSLPVRVVRVLLAGIVFLLLHGTLLRGLFWLQVPANDWSQFLAAILSCFLTFWGCSKTYLHMGLYKKTVQASTTSI